MKEEARKCERCNQKWFAERPVKAPKPRWYDEGGTPWGSGAARVARLQGNYERSLASQERWARCPNCGSVKVATVSQKGFVPTGVESAGIASDPISTTEPSPATATQSDRKQSNPFWTWLKAFMSVHWRIVLAIFCTIGVVVFPFAGEGTGEKIGGTLMYLIGAVVFWTLYRRHAATKLVPESETAPELRDRLDISIDDGWSRRLSSCREKASVFNEVGSATTSDTVKSWLSSMSDEIDAQLVLADDLAALGRSLEPQFDGSDEPTNPAAAEAWSRLEEFEVGLNEAITGAAQVRLNSLSPANNLESIRGQLDMLKSQLPTLDLR